MVSQDAMKMYEWIYSNRNKYQQRPEQFYLGACHARYFPCGRTYVYVKNQSISNLPLQILDRCDISPAFQKRFGTCTENRRQTRHFPVSVTLYRAGGDNRRRKYFGGGDRPRTWRPRCYLLDVAFRLSWHDDKLCGKYPRH